MAASFCRGECLVQVFGTKTLDGYVTILIAEGGCIVIGTIVAPTGGIVRFWNGDHTSGGICSLSADERRNCRENEGNK